MDADVLLVGGGLANGLCALALRRRHPGLRLAMLEGGPAIGGNHTWSFHATDLDEESEALVAPLVEHRWERVTVAFPDHERRLSIPYRAFTSAALDRAVRAALDQPGSQLLLNARATRVTASGATLAGGGTIHAPLVLDARGPAPATAHTEGTAWQKFLGLEVETADDVDGEPVVMDARLAQDDGYHFMYVLPFGRRRALVEATWYSDGPDLDRPAIRARIAAHLQGRGWRVARTVREEAGCLPLPLDARVAPSLGSPLRLGYQGGWLHPTTGYSLPLAARVATAIAREPAAAVSALAALEARVRRQIAFCIRLNRLFFRAVPPAERWRVLSRFYRLPEETIARFYALETTAADRARLLCGRPPRGLSLRAALLAAQAV